MEKMDTLIAKYLEVAALYHTSNGPMASYYEGKMVGMAEAVADLLGITWLEATVKLAGH